MTNETKQTAVEWVVEQLWNEMNMQGDGAVFNALLEQAKEIEKQHIIDAYDLGSLSDMQYPDPKTVIENGEQYYNETYGGNK